MTSSYASVRQPLRTAAGATAPSWWWMVVAGVLAACLLGSFIVLLNQSIHRGELLREQQRADGQASFERATAARSRGRDRSLLTATR